MNKLQHQAMNTVTLQKAKIGSNFKLVVADLLFFSNYNQLHDMLEDPSNHKQRVAEDLLLFSRGSKIYDQIRVLDLTGMEVIRINFSNNKSVIVPEKELQFKGDRYYFKDTAVLRKAEIYISPFDLNIEQGVIELPLKPMIRFGTPILDRNGQKRGAVIFNYLGNTLIQDMKEMFVGSPGHSMLLNTEGYWLVGRDIGVEWGFMYDNGKERTMQNNFPEAWNVISAADSGQFRNEYGLFTFETVYPLMEGWKSSTGSADAFAPSLSEKTAREYFWKIASIIPRDYLNAEELLCSRKYILITGIVFALLAAGSWVLAGARIARKEAEQSLRRSRDDLEQAVTLRTIDLDKANKELQESENRFRQFFENEPEYCYMISPDGLFLDVNMAALAVLGYQKEELIGKPLQMIYAPESLPEVKNNYENWKTTGKLSDIEMVILTKSGEKRTVLLSADSVKDTQGKVLHSISVQRDITELKKAEKETRIANAELLAINRIVQTCSSTLKLQEILEKVLEESLKITGLEGGTICLVTPDETLELAAHRATSEATIIDLTTNEVKVGDCLCGECARDHRPLILPDRKAVLRYSTREATRGEDIRFHAAFPFVTVEKCLGVLCVFTRTDRKPLERSLKLLETITAQIAIAVENARFYEETAHHAATLEESVKERTQELSKSQTALQYLLEDVNEANEKLKELDRLKSMFIASMSHELRTPLNSIIGFTGIILKGMTGEITSEQRDQLERVSRAGKHLLSLITDVIDISKIEAGKITPQAGEFLLADVIDEALDGVRKQVQDQGLALEKQLPEKPVSLYTDRRRLLQCLLNFLSNSVKFTEKGTIKISASNEHGSVRISVSDAGIGIKPEKMQFLFKSFVRLESHLKTARPGTGLGLYLTKKLATEVLGGDVFAKSIEGKGSTFSIVIPANLITVTNHLCQNEDQG
ncbi:MAG: PAS domain S-box protein [Desulfatirhabdiaceae bacterium]|nr:PAS domain S-box protein [Desulfatirhabdiaceae bacterium]